MSQSAFSKIFGVNQNTVSRWEKGQVLSDKETLKKIADYGGVTVVWLLHGEDIKTEMQQLREGGEKKTEIREEQVPFERPAPGDQALKEPFLYAAVDTAMLAQIMLEVNKLLKKRKRELSEVRRAHLYSLLYDQFQKTGKLPDRAKIEEFLRLAG